MLAEIPAEHLSTEVEQCARELLAEAGIRRPPVDAVQLAERLELLVASDTTMKRRARFVRLGEAGRGTILVSNEPRDERKYWAVAHEVGEWAAHRFFARLGVPMIDIQPSWQERLANRLASCLLLPKDWFVADGRALNWDLWEMKEIYQTASHELIARRMLTKPPSVIITLFDQGNPQ